MSTNEEESTPRVMNDALRESLDHEARLRAPLYGTLTLFIASIIGAVMVWLGATLGLLYGHVTGWILPLVPLIGVAVFAAYYHFRVWRWNRKHDDRIQPKLLAVTVLYAIVTTIALYVLAMIELSLIGFASDLAARVTGSLVRGYAGMGGFWPWFIFGGSALFGLIAYHSLVRGAMCVRTRVFGTKRGFVRWVVALLVATLATWLLFGLSSVSLSG